MDITWFDSIARAFDNAWLLVAQFIPSLIAAIVVLLVGILVASLLRVAVERVIHAIKLDVFLRKLGVETFTKRGNMKLDSGVFLGAIVFWFFILVSVLAASDILGLWGLSLFIGQVLLYIPNIVIAIVIVLASILVGHFVRGLIQNSVKGAKLHASSFLGTLAWWVSVVFGCLAALLQLGVGEQIIQTIIIGVIAMLSLAGGIAFGIGGKDYAAHLIQKLRERVE